MGRKVRRAASPQRGGGWCARVQMGIVRSGLMIGGEEMGWMWRNRSIAKITKRTANLQLDFSWSVSCALGCTTSAESGGN